LNGFPGRFQGLTTFADVASSFFEIFRLLGIPNTAHLRILLDFKISTPRKFLRASVEITTISLAHPNPTGHSIRFDVLQAFGYTRNPDVVLVGSDG